jgi:hypothetical protein
MNERRFSANPY